MEKLRNFLIVCFGIVIGIGVQILVMINGWGLEPKSYWWIIGISLFGSIFSQMIIMLITTDY